MRRFHLIIIIFHDGGMILALDRQYDALVPDLAPKRVRDVVELHQLALDGDEFVMKRRHAGRKSHRRLVVTVLADVHHITQGEAAAAPIDPALCEGCYYRCPCSKSAGILAGSGTGGQLLVFVLGYSAVGNVAGGP